VARTQVAILDVHVSVEADDPAVFAAVEKLLETYPRSDAPSPVAYRLSSTPWGRMWKNGELTWERERGIDLVAGFELDLYTTLAALTPLGWVLHAGAIAIDGRAAVLVGPSGAGKSTMTYAMLARGGARYVSDECVTIDAAGRVRGVPRPIAFDHPPPIAPPDGYVVRPAALADPGSTHVVVVPPTPVIVRSAKPIAALVHLRHAPDEAPGVLRLGASEALIRLYPETMNASPAVVELAMDLLMRVSALEVVTRTIEQGCEAIEEAIGRASGEGTYLGP